MKRKKSGSGRHAGDPIMNLDDREALALGDTLRATVRDQLRAGDPPEVKTTHRRLLGSGYSDSDSVEMITAVLVSEIYDMMNEGREFDAGLYAAKLARLPELPFDSDA
jgi:hypothetical protein